MPHRTSSDYLIAQEGLHPPIFRRRRTPKPGSWEISIPRMS